MNFINTGLFLAVFTLLFPVIIPFLYFLNRKFSVSMTANFSYSLSLVSDCWTFASNYNGTVCVPERGFNAPRKAEVFLRKAVLAFIFASQDVLKRAFLHPILDFVPTLLIIKNYQNIQPNKSDEYTV